MESDSARRGLYVTVLPNSRRLFLSRLPNKDGKLRWSKFEPDFPELTLAAARDFFDERKRANKKRNEGVVVEAQKMTNAEFFEEWYDHFLVKKRKNPADVRRAFEKDVLPSIRGTSRSARATSSARRRLKRLSDDMRTILSDMVAQRPSSRSGLATTGFLRFDQNVGTGIDEPAVPSSLESQPAIVTATNAARSPSLACCIALPSAPTRCPRRTSWCCPQRRGRSPRIRCELPSCWRS